MNEGITNDVKNGFIISLLQHNRPPYELLSPNKQDLNQKFKQEFEGMSDEVFSVDDCICIFDELVSKIKVSLTNEDKHFIFTPRHLKNKTLGKKPITEKMLKKIDSLTFKYLSNLYEALSYF